MFKVGIKTPTYNYYLSEMYPNAILKHRVIFKGNESVKAIITIKTSRDENIKVVDEHRCELALCILKSGAIIGSAEVFKRTIIWNIICKDNNVLERAIKNLEESGIGYEIIYKTNLNEKFDKITYNEYLMLKLAFEKGFFESPKKIKLDDLTKILGVSKSTASETLRRAIKKVVMRYFEL